VKLRAAKKALKEAAKLEFKAKETLERSLSHGLNGNSHRPTLNGKLLSGHHRTSARRATTTQPAILPKPRDNQDRQSLASA